MQTLFVISALCFFALLLAAIAIDRRVRTRRGSTNAPHDFAHHLIAAAEDQNSRVPHIFRHQTVREILEKKSRNESSAVVADGPDTQIHQSSSPKRF